MLSIISGGRRGGVIIGSLVDRLFSKYINSFTCPYRHQLSQTSRILTMAGISALVYADDLYKIVSNHTWTKHQDSLEEFSPAAIIGFCLFNAALMLGTLSSLAPLPGHEGGTLWPIFVKEHYSIDTSQKLLDPYSISHVNHGMLGFLIMSYLGADLGIGFIITLGSAVLWEILENTKFVIDLFRENSGPSEEYRGDSKVNVVGDVLSCSMGYALAVIMSRWGGALPAAAWVVITELVSTVKYRDSIILMTVQILAPSAEVSKWQTEILPEKFKDRRGYWANRRQSSLYSTIHLARTGAFNKLISRLVKIRDN